MEDLITNAHVLFDDGKQSAPLPPTPIGEPAPKYSYGSKSTKFTPPAPLPLTPSSLSSEDFTPRLPPRPTNSIHPSLRSGQASPTKDRMDVPPLPPLRSPVKPTTIKQVSEDSTRVPDTVPFPRATVDESQPPPPTDIRASPGDDIP